MVPVPATEAPKLPPPPSGWTNDVSSEPADAVEEERRAAPGPAVLSCGRPDQDVRPTAATADAEAGRRRRVRVLEDLRAAAPVVPLNR